MVNEEKTPYGYIYRAINRLNGKNYIGQTVTSRWGEDKNSMEERWKEEIREAYARQRRGMNLRYVENAIIKHGSENFELKEECVANSQEDLDEKETHYIKEYDSMNPDKGYNMKEGGLGGRLSEFAKEKLSKIGKEKWQKDPEYYNKQAKERRERAQDPEWIEKMTDINRERAKDPEWREKVSKSGTEKWKDKEYQEKQTNERRERAKDPEWIEKMTEVNQEIARNPETQKKMSKSLSQKWQDQKYQENVSQGLTGKWQESKYRERQFKARIDGKREITDKGEFLKDIQKMKKMDLNIKYDMDGKSINKRIKEMIGHRGVNNFSEAKDYLKDKNLDEVVKDIKETQNEQSQKFEGKKEISNKREFLEDIQNMQAKEISQKYNMNRSTVNKRIQEMLGEHGVKNYTEAKNYLEDKNLDEVVKDIEERTSDKQSEKPELDEKSEEKIDELKEKGDQEVKDKESSEGKSEDNKEEPTEEGKEKKERPSEVEQKEERSGEVPEQKAEELQNPPMVGQSEKPDSNKEESSENSFEMGLGISKIKRPPKKGSPHFDERRIFGYSDRKDYNGIEKVFTDKMKDYGGIADASKKDGKDYSGLDEKTSEEMGKDFDGIDEPRSEKAKDYDYINEGYGEAGGGRG